MSGTQRADREPIGILGAGYVGLVTGACLASLGHEVVLRDIDEAKVESLQSGRVPIYEPGLAELVSSHRQKLSFTLDMGQLLRSARLIFVAVGTPPMYSGDADLSSIYTVLREMAEQRASESHHPAPARHLLIMKSTVPPGTGERLRAEMERNGLREVGYVSNPEFLREGNAISDFMEPDRVVIGAFEPADAERVAALYQPLAAPVIQTSVTSAEMIKYAANAFLATKISFINEIANVCEEVGADVDTVAHGMGLDARIGPHFLRAGLGYGGSCFPKDVAALKQLAGNSGYHFQLLTAVIEVNELQKRRVIGKLKKHLGELAGKTVALLGLTFKPGTDDLREAASLVLAARLLAEGANVRGYDPVAGAAFAQLIPSAQICDSAEAALEGADGAILITEWPELIRLDWEAEMKRMARPVIIDGRNALDPDRMTAAGYAFEGIGRA